MSDKIKGCTVVFDHDFHEEDVKHLLDAISMIKGVAVVEPVILEGNDLIDRARVKYEFTAKLLNFIKEIK